MRIAALMLFVGVGCCCLGFYLGRGSRAALREEREAALALRSDESLRPAFAGACVASVSPEVLRAELSRALEGAGVPASPGDKSPHDKKVAPAVIATPPAPPSPEQLAVLEKARSGVDRSISSGNMTKAEALDLREHFQRLDDQSRHELTTRLAVALNQGKLTLEENQLPF